MIGRLPRPQDVIDYHLPVPKMVETLLQNGAHSDNLSDFLLYLKTAEQYRDARKIWAEVIILMVQAGPHPDTEHAAELQKYKACPEE